ncbi:hypothetical protein [Candidatus Laterigemmans baculatus]|uniref:hypothetical protein n=1 Tax=Candidatus Laterigemmans baculatus TaxID=2770505 RepID=UPI0013DAE0D3|nr:hypothetical protein [Candidatus Laterigemmans baculatus]
MRSFVAALPFVVLTIVCWGNYGPLMHQGQHYMHDALHPFIGVGFAYFVIAVLAPSVMLKISGERGHWSREGALFSFISGAVGALGALGVILAFTFQGKPMYVMPLVFGGAPIVNTIVTMWMAKSHTNISKKFLLGVLTAAIGAAGVLYFKPAPQATAPAAEHVAETAAAEVPEVVAAEAETQLSLVALSVLMAIVCWGSYGPMLHKGQMKMGGSRLRPFLCVGAAYFLIAVALPLLILPMTTGLRDWSTPGMTEGWMWSLAGGAAGALGALGIVLAFNFGGKPIFVMPLIFGLAPVMNTITTVTGAGSWGRIGPEFIAAVLVTIAGAVSVLVFAPKPTAPPAKPVLASEPSTTAAPSA